MDIHIHGNPEFFCRGRCLKKQRNWSVFWENPCVRTLQCRECNIDRPTWFTSVCPFLIDFCPGSYRFLSYLIQKLTYLSCTHITSSVETIVATFQHRMRHALLSVITLHAAMAYADNFGVQTPSKHNDTFVLCSEMFSKCLWRPWFALPNPRWEGFNAPCPSTGLARIPGKEKRKSEREEEIIYHYAVLRMLLSLFAYATLRKNGPQKCKWETRRYFLCVRLSHIF